jgi:adenylate cyclase
MDQRAPNVLVVDDNEMNRDVLNRRLSREGYEVQTAENGRLALELLAANPESIDLILLDIMMPEMNGYQALEVLKADDTLKHIPVIMITAVDEIDSVVRCIEMGAEDYLHKPFNPVLLQARIGASLEKKQMRDREQAYIRDLELEREKSDRLLLNILPGPIAARLKETEGTLADHFTDVTVLFADIVDFTRLSAGMHPTKVVNLLNEIFSEFDRLAEERGLEKIKTIGDAYLVVGGIPQPRADHAEAIGELALDMKDAINFFAEQLGIPFNMRIGINSGSVVAGVIGSKKFIYDLWGDTVNVASRMESHGLPGCIQVTQDTYNLLRDTFLFEERGIVDIKGRGQMQTYLLVGREGRLSPCPVFPSRQAA